jgi:hypothetical protein
MRFIVFFLFVTILLSHQSYAQDTLYTSSNNVLYGEIKSMSKSVLTFDTDYADSDFKVDWDEVVGLSSSTKLVVYTSDGERYYGLMRYYPNEEKTVFITSVLTKHETTLDKIVQIGTLNSSFLERITISIDAGYSYSKASNLSQFSMTGRVSYNADNWRLAGGFNNVATSQDGIEPTTRNEANIDFTRVILGNAFAFAGMEFLENSEQQLDLRTTSKLGVGYYFVRTNGWFLQGAAGMANANEKYAGDNPSTQNSFEGLTSLELDAYDIGDISFHAKVNAFPSFSTKNRIRVNSNISFKWDLPLDFYVKASFIHNYDNKPLVEGVDKSDFVFQTGIGWEWD